MLIALTLATVFLLEAEAGLYGELVEGVYDGCDALALEAARLLVELHLGGLRDLFYANDDVKTDTQRSIPAFC